MIDFEYLYQGICGLANAHKAGTMAGHLGAAVVAGYFLGEDHGDWPEEVFRGIQGELDRVIAGEESIWFNAQELGISPTDLFEPFPDQPPQSDAIDLIVEALGKNVDRTRQSGHNTIFASIAVRALRDHPRYARPSIIAGIRRLIEAFNNTHAGQGYYGKERGWLKGDQVELTPEHDFAMYASIPRMVDVTLQELITTAAIKKQGFGGPWHVVNHAAAITELDRFGYHDVANRALAAHHQHVRLWRSLPNVESELGSMSKSAHDPREPVYWEGSLKRDEARLTHRIKTLYGFYTLGRFAREDEATMTNAQDALLYLMA